MVKSLRKLQIKTELCHTLVNEVCTLARNIRRRYQDLICCSENTKENSGERKSDTTLVRRHRWPPKMLSPVTHHACVLKRSIVHQKLLKSYLKVTHHACVKKYGSLKVLLAGTLLTSSFVSLGPC